jgi:hypothetical protein
VLRVAAEAVGTLAAWVAQASGRLGLALRPRSRLAFARDDLERDVEAGPLVAGQPDRPGAAAAERPQGSVPPEDELALGLAGAAFDISFPGLAKPFPSPARPMYGLE